VNIKRIPQQLRVYFLVTCYTFAYIQSAIAAPLEDITLLAEKDRMVATIILSSKVTNVRYTPKKKAKSLSIFLDRVPGPAVNEEWRDDVVLTSPPSSLIPSFNVKVEFTDQSERIKIHAKLLINFSREAEYTVQLGRDGRSIIVGIKKDQAEKIQPKFDSSLPLLPELLEIPSNASENDKKAGSLMLQGRNFLAVGDNFPAIDALNKLLLLPPNASTQMAQEWVGVARERAGQLDKAKLEFDLYLKLYTDPEDTRRIKARLASLGSKPPKPIGVTAETGTEKKKPTQVLTYGSISMHYYHGASKSDTVDNSNTFANTSAQTTFSTVDQSALLTAAYATERFVSEHYDNRIVFQGTAYTNLLPDQVGRNSLGALYVEVKDKLYDYSARVGRQSPSGGGVLGRFDGASIGYGLTPSVRVNAEAGQLSDNGDVKPVFYGASVDMGPVSVFAVNQTTEGLIDRRAVGTEMRYFETNKNAFMLLDYDILFKGLNVALLQGTYTPTPENTISLFIDHRRTPYLTTRNALNGSKTSSLADLLQVMTTDDIRTLAAGRTGTSNLAQLGVTQQVSAKWQTGVDVRVSNFESLAATGTQIDPFVDPNSPVGTPGSPTDPLLIQGYVPDSGANGNDWAISTQLLGANLYSTQDVTVLNASLLGSPLYHGYSVYMYTHRNWNEKWSMDVSLQFFKQNFDSGLASSRILPSLRTSYQIKQTVNVDMEVGYEINHTENGPIFTDGTRNFYSFGIRWDF